MSSGSEGRLGARSANLRRASLGPDNSALPPNAGSCLALFRLHQGGGIDRDALDERVDLLAGCEAEGIGGACRDPCRKPGADIDRNVDRGAAARADFDDPAAKDVEDARLPRLRRR